MQLSPIKRQNEKVENQLKNSLWVSFYRETGLGHDSLLQFALQSGLVPLSVHCSPDNTTTTRRLVLL